MRVLPSMSVNRNVSVPVGGGAGMGVGLGIGIGRAGPFATLAGSSGQFAQFGQLPGLVRDCEAPKIRLTGRPMHQYSLSRTTPDRST
jgi:hypothetical protein